MDTGNATRVAIILLFAIAFTMVGSFAPVMYAAYLPQDQIIEKHSFVATDTTTSAGEHHACFDRTVHRPASGETIVELYILSESGDRVEVDSRSSDNYYHPGRDSVLLTMALPEDLRAGTYRYVLVAEMKLANGQVTRSFAFESTTFNVSRGAGVSSESPLADC